MVAMKPPKASRAKKDAVGEKRKDPLSPVHETLSEGEAAAVEPTVPKKSRYRKKSDTPKEQGVVFREGVPEASKSPLVPAGDKGKKKVVEESSPPSKRQRVASLPEVVDEPLAPEAELKNMVNLYLSVDEATGSSGQALATQAVTSVVEALNFVGGELWANLQKSKINNLLELSLRTSVVVSTLSILIHHIIFTYHIHQYFLLQLILSEHPYYAAIRPSAGGS